MKIRYITIISLSFLFLLLSAEKTKAQFFDDFNDGVIPQEWTGEISKFRINQLNQLQLDAPAQQDSAWISRPSTQIDEVEWQLWVRMDFASSNNNRVSIYLVSDQEDLTGPLNGYFVRIGENGNDVAIELYRQTGYTKTLLGRGTDGLFASAFSSRIKVLRNSNGEWDVYVDPTGSNFFQHEFTVTDTVHTSTAHFGMVCFYTSTRSDRFYFDEIYAGAPLIDTIAPEVVEVIPRSATELDIYFSEGVELTSANSTGNYFVGNGVGNPQSAQRDPMNFSKVNLVFSNPFPTDGSTVNLTVSDIEDAAGNVLSSQTVPFSFYVAGFNDVVISEILPRTTPVIGLPAHQFVEIYNRSGRDLNMLGWTFSDRTSTTWLPDINLPADSFLILTTNAGANSYMQFGKTVGLSPWPSLNLTSDDLTLKNQNGKVIFYLPYTSDWYGDDQKKNEGWSIEMIDTDNPCGGKDNWAASVDSSGGTPGRKNSIAFSNPDVHSPQLIRAFVETPNKVVLYFNETIDSTVAADIQNYLIDGGIGQPISSTAVPPAFTEVSLTLSQSLQTGETYLVETSNLTDCSGNVIEDKNTARFGIPEQIDSFDVIINEVLYYPVVGSSRFVEIYNRSDKVINLQDLRLLRLDPDDGSTIGNAVIVSDVPFLMFPGDYVVITPNAEHIAAQYFVPSMDQVLTVSGFPAYPNNQGVVALRNKQAKTIDKLHYQNNWHFELLSSRGVSLERRDFDRPTQDKSNWFSAASTVGYATPGYQNSQFASIEIDESGVFVEPDVFSPNGDGHQDLLNIKYMFDDPGYVANITIYDDQGRPVRNLVRNKLLDKSGVVNWDGINDIGEKASIGIYIVVAEIFNLDGTVKTYRKSAVLAGRL